MQHHLLLPGNCSTRKFVAKKFYGLNSQQLSHMLNTPICWILCPLKVCDAVPQHPLPTCWSPSRQVSARIALRSPMSCHVMSCLALQWCTWPCEGWTKRYQATSEMVGQLEDCHKKQSLQWSWSVRSQIGNPKIRKVVLLCGNGFYKFCRNDSSTAGPARWWWWGQWPCRHPGHWSLSAFFHQTSDVFSSHLEELQLLQVEAASDVRKASHVWKESCPASNLQCGEFLICWVFFQIAFGFKQQPSQPFNDSLILEREKPVAFRFRFCSKVPSSEAASDKLQLKTRHHHAYNEVNWVITPKKSSRSFRCPGARMLLLPGRSPQKLLAFFSSLGLANLLASASVS